MTQGESASEMDRFSAMRTVEENAFAVASHHSISFLNRLKPAFPGLKGSFAFLRSGRIKYLTDALCD
jgi:hypothetical protein